MDHGTVESVGASIGFRTFNARAASPKILALACGGALFSDASFPAVEMDIRGIGDSRISPDQLRERDLQSYLADVDAVLKQTKANSRTALLGYSHAGYFVVAYALANPDKASALVLVEPALFTSKTELLKRARLAEGGKVDEAMNAMLSYVEPKLGGAQKATVRKDLVKAIQNGEAVAAEWRVRAQHPIGLRELSALKMPVLLVGGSESKHRQIVTKAASVIPNASVWWIQGAGHLDLIEPKFTPKLTEVVEVFLNSLTAK